MNPPPLPNVPDKKKKKTPRTKDSTEILEVEDTRQSIELNAKESCPFSFVTVYSDRAEVTRDLSVQLQKGTSEIIVSGISQFVDENSIRVAGAKGNATILEVSPLNKYTKTVDESESKTQQLKDEIVKIDKKISQLRADLERIKKESNWLEAWAMNLMNPVRNDKQEVLVDPFINESFGKTENFLNFYQKRLRNIDEHKESVDQMLEELTKERTKFDNEIRQLPRASTTGDHLRQILIVVHCKAPTRLDLQVAYLVFGASWKASYDVRVVSGDSKLELTYYGAIINDTMEDWNSTNLALSTAQPSVAGKPPELYTKFVTFQRPAFHGHHSMLNTQVAVSAPVFTNPLYSQAEVSAEVSSSQVPRSLETEVLTTKSTESATSTSFVIQRKAAILADKKPHKVVIRQIPLLAEYTYTLLPKLSPHSYLKANIKNNTRDCTLLPGPLNVFVDNNFVAKSEVPLVSPNESFAIFLGVDPGIKFEYQPLRHLKETQGYIQKTNLLVVKYNTVISNLKGKDAKVALFDSLPKSNDTMVKVKLLEPLLVEGENTKLTAANNIQWKIDIPAGEKRVIPFKYTVEYPYGRELENAF